MLFLIFFSLFSFVWFDRNFHGSAPLRICKAFLKQFSFEKYKKPKIIKQETLQTLILLKKFIKKNSNKWFKISIYILLPELDTIKPWPMKCAHSGNTVHRKSTFPASNTNKLFWIHLMILPLTQWRQTDNFIKFCFTQSINYYIHLNRTLVTS